MSMALRGHPELQRIKRIHGIFSYWVKIPSATCKIAFLRSSWGYSSLRYHNIYWMWSVWGSAILAGINASVGKSELKEEGRVNEWREIESMPINEDFGKQSGGRFDGFVDYRLRNHAGKPSWMHESCKKWETSICNLTFKENTQGSTDSAKPGTYCLSKDWFLFK